MYDPNHIIYSPRLLCQCPRKSIWIADLPGDGVVPSRMQSLRPEGPLVDKSPAVECLSRLNCESCYFKLLIPRLLPS
jgi:hypothetical protein